MFPDRKVFLGAVDFFDSDGGLLPTKIVILLVIFVFFSSLFYFWADEGVVYAALGGGFIAMVYASGGVSELLLSVMVSFMLKFGGSSALALLKPWGVGKAFDETLHVIQTLHFLHLTIGFFVLFFIFVVIPQHAISRWWQKSN